MRRPLVFVKQAIVTMAAVLYEPALLSPSMIEVLEPWPQKRASRMKVVEAGRRDPAVRLELESERVASVQYLRRCSGSTALRRRDICLDLAIVRDGTKRRRDVCQVVAGPAKRRAEVGAGHLELLRASSNAAAAWPSRGPSITSRARSFSCFMEPSHHGCAQMEHLRTRARE